MSKQYDYYPNSSRLKSNEKYNFEYDNNGNLTKKSTINGDIVWNYEYDLLNRLVKVAKNNEDVASYVYDESGLRLKKQGIDKAVYYVFDTGGDVLYEQENREYLEYVYVLGKHFARVDGNLDNLGDRTKYFYHTDHLGSTVAVTDEAGQTVWASEYTPFGGKHSVAGEMAKAAKFTGKDLDEDIGLYYFNARWYDQEIGRFISQDPIQHGLNWYTYATNNPLRFIDPKGLSEEESTTCSYTPEAGTGYLAAARYIMENSGREWLKQQIKENPDLVKEIAQGIQMSFEMQGISLQAGQTYELQDIGVYIPRLAVGNKSSSSVQQNINSTNTSSINPKLKYFVIHDTGIDGEKLSKYNEPHRRKEFYGKVHGFLDSQGEYLEITPFNEVARGTRMDRNLNKGAGEMVHIELLLNQGTPTKAHYYKLAEIYNELTGGQASLIIVPHREVDRGVPGGHNDPRNFDFNYFYQVLKEKYNINVTPGVTGITQERYQQKNDADMVQNWPPVLSGPAERKKQ